MKGPAKAPAIHTVSLRYARVVLATNVGATSGGEPNDAGPLRAAPFLFLV